ncbi:HLA class II histocompatibility antigen gamma chain isoform X2 [Hyperolius riggenbachi]|uniref:HLA class II histocompatibility antigen gamma chain isoform X2 n=1 Tax=Hyperolius riggenbachi TaxID=752182 RepID=UPI0035A359F5
MAEEAQNLVPAEDPREEVVRQPRTLTCNKNAGMTVLSVFVGLLLVGQAVSVYFMTQQHSTIQDLTATTTALKLKDMIKNLPGSPPSQHRPKLRIASFSIPLAYSDTDGSPQNLEKIAQESNKIEDAAKYFLLRTNPLRKYPSFNATALENLRKLKKTLNDQEWMAFDAWLQQWYLFHLVQTTETSDSTPATPKPTGIRKLLPWRKLELLPAERGPSGHLVYASPSPFSDSEPSFIDESPSGAPVSDCQLKAGRAMPGKFVPQCDERGQYQPKQCWRSTGFCWCVYNNGTEVPDTRSKAKIDCSDFQVPFTPLDTLGAAKDPDAMVWENPQDMIVSKNPQDMIGYPDSENDQDMMGAEWQ